MMLEPKKLNNIKMENQSLNTSCEPMDIDTSMNSVKSMEISYNDRHDSIRSGGPSPLVFSPTPKNDYIERAPSPDVVCLSPNIGMTEMMPVKKYHINIPKHAKERSSQGIRKLAALLAIFVAILIYYSCNIVCTDELNLQHINNNLNSKVYGQHTALELIAKSLNTKVKSKILFLYGGTGVGKTYAASLILEDIWNSSNIYHYTMPTFTEIFPNNLLIGITICKTSVLVVDDLTISDMHISAHIKNAIEKSENLNRNITVILIFNTDNNDVRFANYQENPLLDFYVNLSESFSDINVYKEFIKFEPLKEEHLKKCVENELGFYDVDIMNKIIKNFNVSMDGCKGVHKRVRMLNYL